MHAEATALLQTKLDIPPPRAHLLPRRHLLALLPPAPQTRLVLLSAPAGFGKTTFLSLWCQALAAQQNTAVAWLALDQSDNDPAHFLAYLSATLARALAPQGIDDLATPPQAGLSATGIERLLIQLLNRLAAQERDCLLVLDDYHLISAPAVHAAVAFMLEHLPAQACLAIASRADPPLPLARLRARAQLLELRAADLRFTPEEIAAFFAAANLALSAGELQAIDAIVEGWPAGIQLLALALRSQACQHASAGLPPDPSAAGGILSRIDGSQPHLFAYLAEEVFAQQPAHLKAFLVQTSVLERLCGPLCDAVLARAPGEQGPADSYSRRILEQLDHTNLFLTPLDGERRWYRYHHLFQAFLHDRLEREAPGAVAELHLRASAWYERNQLLVQAVEHALAARAFERAAELVEAAALAVVERGAYATLHRWLEHIPHALLEARPALCLWAAWAALLAGEVERIDPLLERAQRAWQAEGDRPKRGELAHLQAHLARLRHDAAQTAATAWQALADLAEEEATLRAGSVLALGAGLLLAGDLGAADAALAQARAECQAHNALGLLVALRCLGELAARRGQLHLAAERYQEVLAAPGERDLWERWAATIGLGELARERNDLAQAEELLRSALTAAERAGVAVYFVPGYIALARTLLARGAFAPAEAALEQAAYAARRLGSPAYARQVAAERARLALARGDLAAAERWEAERAPVGEGVLDIIDGVEMVTSARLLLAQGRAASGQRALSAAQVLLTRLRREAEAQGRTGELIEILALSARLEAAIGRRDLALRALEHALTLAAPQGYARVFLDEGEEMRQLLAAYRAQLARRERGAAREMSAQLRAYLDALLAAFEAPVAAHAPADGGRHDGLVETLSERERDVLRQIAGGASNQAIAEALVISIGTVKSHINHILGKLAARSRTEAVARARELGLLAE